MFSSPALWTLIIGLLLSGICVIPFLLLASTELDDGDEKTKPEIEKRPGAPGDG